MEMVICAVLDTAAGVFGRPMFVRSKGEALRVVQDEVNRASDENPLNRHSADFRLFFLGTFDDNSGLIAPLAMPELMADCGAMKGML